MALTGLLGASQAGDGSFPAVMVCHENRGLNEHIRDVARRFAKAGYVGLAIDMLSRQGGTDAAGGASSAPGLLSNIPPQQFVDDFKAGLLFLQSQAFVAPDRIGMTGFCFGGGVTWRCATQIPELRAAVPFYGPNPPLENVPKIQAAVLAIYAEQDRRINAGILRYRDSDARQQQDLQAHHLSQRQPRVSQRHRLAIRRGGCKRRVEPDPCLVCGVPVTSVL